MTEKTKTPEKIWNLEKLTTSDWNYLKKMLA